MTDNDDLRERVATLEQMLESRRSSLASCERMLELLQPEWDRFEKRDGSHDTYVARDYADHTSAARKHRKEIAALEAALSATPIEALQQRVERLEVALRGLLSSYIGTCRFDGRVISEIEQHHCVIDARAALGDVG